MKIQLPILVALVLCACSATTDSGVRWFVGTGPNKAEQQAAIERGDRVAPELEAMASQWASASAPGVIVVGDIGALNTMDGKQLRAFHTSFAKALAKRQPGRAMSGNADDFAAHMGGWSSIETFGMAGIVKFERPAVVRSGDLPAIGFAGNAGALFGTTGDLVAARSDDDGMLVVDRVLCRERAQGYKECTRRYARGHFDSAGMELNGDLHLKNGGQRIDPASYALLKE